MSENLEANREQFLQIAREGAAEMAAAANPYVDGILSTGWRHGFTEGFALAEVSGFFVFKDREEAARLEAYKQGGTACVEAVKSVVGQLVGEGFDQGYDLGYENAKADLEFADLNQYKEGYNNAVLDIAEWGMETGKLSPRKVRMIQDDFLMEEPPVELPPVLEPENQGFDEAPGTVTEEELLAALQCEFGRPTDEGSDP